MLRFCRISSHLQMRQSNYQAQSYFFQRFSGISKEKYERKTPIEHILLRPEMYVGQITPSLLNTWIYNEELNKMEKANVYFSPALVKIYDEILVNAADNRWRSSEMSYIDIAIQINDQNLQVSIQNNGRTVPIEYDEKEKLYVPELIFGHLMTGSNFDDTKGRVTGGMHGYGAKLTNIFSTSFELEIFDAVKKQKYTQKWTNHMKSVSSPEILNVEASSGSHKDSYMRVTFTPDLPLFSTSLSPNDPSLANVNDLFLIFYRRALDLSGVGLFGLNKSSPPIQVRYNGKVIAINTFADYVNLFASETESMDPNNESDVSEKIHQPAKLFQLNGQWEIGIIPSPTGNFEQMSFVNSVWTSRGGTHVSHITNQCVKYIQEVLANMEGDPTAAPVSPAKIKSHLMLFVNCLIENPSFDSQGKESLTTKLSQISSQSEISTKFLKKIFGPKSELIQSIYESNMNRPSLSKPMRGKFGKSVIVDGLEDAHKAGPSKYRSRCTLIVTEGESAKALAIAGLEIVGRELYGVLPVQGKVINAVNPRTSVFGNKEVIRLCHALGLDTNKDYADGDLSSLRYGHILIMTDQDPDGSHIKGLIINLLNKYWPKLLSCDKFIQQLITPLIKVTGIGVSEEEKNKKSTISFYSEQEYETWRNQIINTRGLHAVKNFSVKYYKGLGTSTSAEGRDYFRNLDLHVKNFIFGEKTIDALDLAFSSKRTEDRKVWLKNYSRSSAQISPTQKNILYEDFIHKDFINFSYTDLNRSIPCVVDGLKVSHRKILYTCFKQNIRKEVKVGQLGGLTTESTAYHYGEITLHKSIIRMAQDFVGSNNVPLLEPCGQFGTRHKGGDDSASPRYIFTKLSSITDLIFPEVDLPILTYDVEDGKQVEPIYFLPIIPMLLVNGTRGIGTGWSTSVPNYNPLDISDYLIRKIKGEEPPPKLLPWVRGFQGRIFATSKQILTTGIVTRKSKTTIEITELPAYKSTEAYKETLFKNLERHNIDITSLKENHTVENVHFEISASKSQLDQLDKRPGVMIKKLGLSSVITSENMHAFDDKLQLQYYPTPESLIEGYFPVRLDGYRRRKDRQVTILTGEELKLRNQQRFISEIFSGKLEITSGGRPISTSMMNQALRSRGYTTQSELDQIVAKYFPDSKVSTSESDAYSYLLSLPIRSLTLERAEILQNRALQTQQDLESLKALSPEEIWLKELSVLNENLIKLDPSFQRDRDS